MKKFHSILLCLILLLAVFEAANAAPDAVTPVTPLSISPEGAITPELRVRMEGALPRDSRTKANINAVTVNSINTLVINRDMVTGHSNIYSQKIDTGRITNQKVSGRCWLFSSLNMLRQPMLKKYQVDTFEFSENYLTFWDKMEKANFFLEAIIATETRDLRDRMVQQLLREPFEDGGQWNYTVALVKKYGIVPKSAMDESYHSSNTGIMDRVVCSLLRKDASLLRKMHSEGKSGKEQRTCKEAMLIEVYRVLTYCLGTPPGNFEWRYEDKSKKASIPKTYTPQEYYQKELGAVLDDYVFLYSCPTWPFNRLYQIDLDRNMVEMQNMTFINIEMNELKDIARKSVEAGEPVWFGCDSSKDMDRDSGIMRHGFFDYGSLFGIDLSMSKEDRVSYHDSTPSHDMVLMGVDIVDGRVRKWLVENSWGKERGNDGYFSMYESWFDEYVYAMVVKKKHVSQATLNLLKTKPIVLPEDDPMRESIRIW
ncbi:MAG: C1 family peptidase [Candidatus Eremiobacteraeota bacterium]|nr:C1 family peptidase [Candidatus Eremiobacteraeota bacterium]